MNGIFALILAFFAILQVSIVVVGHWGTYDWMKRAMAIILALCILIFPLQWAFTKKGRMNLLRSERTRCLGIGYSWVLLATLLFNHL
jgi:hypothetical protein